MLESLAGIIAGLGLFFAGVWLLTDHLKRLTGHRLRQIIITWTRRPLLAFGWGALAGSITLSMSALVFVLVGLMTAGLITVKAAFPIIAGANAGGAILVFLATLDIQLVMLFVLGISGLVLASDSLARWKPIIGTLFGLSLLFLGIDMIQTSALPLVQQPWAESLLAQTRDSYAAGLVLGALLTMVSQSADASSILAITLAGAGVFSIEQTIMTIYGANLGSSVITLILSWKLRGQAMQIALYQIVLNVIGCCILVPLFYLEMVFDIPLVKHLVVALANGIEQQMALVFLLFNIVGGLTMVLLAAWVQRLGDYLFPPTQAEDDARLHYIQPQALQDAETALTLVELEQRRLLGFFTRYFDSLRQGADTAALTRLHEPFRSLLAEIDEYLDLLGQTDSMGVHFEQLNRTLQQQRGLDAVEATLFDLATCIHANVQQPGLAKFSRNVIEAVDTLVLTLQGAVIDNNPYDQKRLRKMTGDRSQAMQKIRNAYLRQETDLAAAAKLGLLKTTNLCERLFWLLDGFMLAAETNVAPAS